MIDNTTKQMGLGEMFEGVVKEQMMTIISQALKQPSLFQTLPQEQEEKLMTADDAAEFLKVSKPTIYKMTSKGTMSFFKRGNRLYFTKKLLMDYVKEGYKGTMKDVQDSNDAFLTMNKMKRNGIKN
jgi:excisionase family DNA binding protein